VTTQVQETVRAKERFESVESRWPPIIALLVVLGLLVLLPGRFRAAPPWVPYVTVFGTIIPMLAFMVTRAQLWRRIERIVTLAFIVLTSALLLISLYGLIASIIGKAGEISGLSLLASAIAIWVGNVVMFSLIYWILDGGGPEARAAGADSEWYFPQQQIPERFDGWRPLFFDYLYLAYETSTAFSSTDDGPLTRRAKFLMMSQSGISLITLVIVAARAINVLK
jgi:uncharacterized membrane protein